MEKNKKNIDIHLCININESLLKLTQYYKSAMKVKVLVGH